MPVGPCHDHIYDRIMLPADKGIQRLPCLPKSYLQRIQAYLYLCAVSILNFCIMQMVHSFV